MQQKSLWFKIPLEIKERIIELHGAPVDLLYLCREMFPMAREWSFMDPRVKLHEKTLKQCVQQGRIHDLAIAVRYRYLAFTEQSLDCYLPLIAPYDVATLWFFMEHVQPSPTFRFSYVASTITRECIPHHQLLVLIQSIVHPSHWGALIRRAIIHDRTSMLSCLLQNSVNMRTTFLDNLILTFALQCAHFASLFTLLHEPTFHARNALRKGKRNIVTDLLSYHREQDLLLPILQYDADCFFAEYPYTLTGGSNACVLGYQQQNAWLLWQRDRPLLMMKLLGHPRTKLTSLKAFLQQLVKQVATELADHYQLRSSIMTKSPYDCLRYCLERLPVSTLECIDDCIILYKVPNSPCPSTATIELLSSLITLIKRRYEMDARRLPILEVPDLTPLSLVEEDVNDDVC